MTMTPSQILQVLASRGVAIRAKENGNLGVMPIDRVDAALREQIIANKPALLALLATPPAKPIDRRQIAWECLLRCEPDAAARARVWRAAEQHEKDWRFLVLRHGYPLGWFLLCHVDNHLRLHHGKGITTEELPDGTIVHWKTVEVTP